MSEDTKSQSDPESEAQPNAKPEDVGEDTVDETDETTAENPVALAAEAPAQSFDQTIDQALYESMPNTASDAGDGFDALGAAAELDAILSADEPAEKVEAVGESYTDILESELAELNALVAERDKQLKAADEEHEKSRARIESAAERKLEQRSRKILIEFVEVLDDLDRALAAARETDHNPAVIDGVELVRKSFLRTLGSFAVKHNPAMGEVFDPHVHDAVSMMSVTDPEQDGKVVAVVREGYLIGEEPLRPAGVVVGKRSS